MAFEPRRWTTFCCLCMTYITGALAVQEYVFLLGGIFRSDPSQEQGALRHVLYKNNLQYNFTAPSIFLTALVENTDVSDSFSVGASFCSLLSREPIVVIGLASSTTLPTIKSYSNTFNITFLTPSLSGAEVTSGKSDFQLYLRPSPIPVLVDIIFHHRWNKFYYLYDDIEGLYRLESLLEIASKRNWIVLPLHLRGNDNVRPFLQRIRASDAYNVVVDTSSINRTESVLTQALQLAMMTVKYHYVVLDFDLQNIDLENFKHNNVNITGLNMVDRTHPRHKDFMNAWTKIIQHYEEVKYMKYIKFQAALTYDSVAVINDALRRMHLDNENLVPEQLTCDHDKAIKQWRHGEKMRNYLKNVEVQGLTGQIKFDEAGRRSNYSIDLMGLVRNEDTGVTTFDKVGTWHSSNPGAFSIGGDGRIVDPTVTDSFNKTLIITTILSEPYYMLKKNADEFDKKEDKYEGYCVELMKNIAKHMPINYKFELVGDSRYGEYSPKTNRWDGMIGELIDGKADIAVAPLTITSERERFVEFTTPFMSVGISIMIKKPQNTKPGVFSFLHPLSHEIWMCIVFAYVGVSVVLFLVSRFSPYEWHAVDSPPPLFGDSGDRQEMANDFGIFNSLWFSLGAFMQQGCDISPRSLSGRIVGGVWWFFTLIIISSYTANLAAFLTVERMVSPIESADDLSKQTEIAYGTVNAGSTKKFFEESDVTVYQKMWAYMSTTEPTVFVETTQAGVERVRSSKGRYAFLFESTMNEYHNQRKPCDTIKVGNNLNSRGYGIATRKGSPLKENLTLAVLQLRELGVLLKLEKSWWVEKGECGPPDSKSQEQANALSLSNVAGVFYILVGGLGLAMVVALLEFCYKSRKEAKTSKTTLQMAMRAKARMSIKGENSTVSTPEFTKSLSSMPITRATNSRTPPKGGSGHPFGRKTLTPSPSEEDLLAKGIREDIYLKERAPPKNYPDHARI
ncbi:LOW QUALITY PROTEIN: glutamate receptor 4-like [Ptychodera flava]|uniref:LOW QUALITY PROTEIN: glutamate receptor 4-like n=1 Tax=Ptychodera flava TaxID=63121 RepID=UPI00396A88FB